jgi:hypothetical protein
MAYEVEVSDDFKAWYENLSEPEQNSIERVLLMLMEAGPALGYPQSTGVKGSTFNHMRELRIQHGGRPYRVLYAFHTTRAAFLLVGRQDGG